MKGTIDWREVRVLLFIMAGVLLLWDTWFVYPLEVLVVFFHEMSHGLAALATGGSIVEITVAADGGGTCLAAGGNRFLILSAGYLGSLAWGGTILVLAARARWDRAVLAAGGVLLLLASVFFVRPVVGFGFAFGLAAGLAMIAAAAWLTPPVNEFLLKVIGLTSCLYAVLDLKSDVLSRTSLPSDARLLSEHTGIPAILWGLLWMAIAGAGAAAFLLQACRRRGGDAAARIR